MILPVYAIIFCNSFGINVTNQFTEHDDYVEYINNVQIYVTAALPSEEVKRYQNTILSTSDHLSRTPTVQINSQCMTA